MPVYASQLWSKYTQTSMKRLCAAYNNAYRIMHDIPRNVNVRPHQVNHCVRTFDALLRNNLCQFFIRCPSSSSFFVHSLQMSDAFYKFSFFINYSQHLYDGDQLQWLLVHCFSVRISSVLLMCSKKKKMCVQCIRTKHTTSKKCWQNVLLLSSVGWSCANTDSAMCYCMTNNFLLSCVYDRVCVNHESAIN